MRVIYTNKVHVTAIRVPLKFSLLVKFYLVHGGINVPHQQILIYHP